MKTVLRIAPERTKAHKEAHREDMSPTKVTVRRKTAVTATWPILPRNGAMRADAAPMTRVPKAMPPHEVRFEASRDVTTQHLTAS
jgi:hypothetical protein